MDMLLLRLRHLFLWAMLFTGGGAAVGGASGRGQSVAEGDGGGDEQYLMWRLDAHLLLLRSGQCAWNRLARPWAQ